MRVGNPIYPIHTFCRKLNKVLDLYIAYLVYNTPIYRISSIYIDIVGSWGIIPQESGGQWRKNTVAPDEYILTEIMLAF